MTKLQYRQSARLNPCGLAGIEKCRSIIEHKKYQKINEVMIDLYTASVIIKIFDAVNSEAKQRLCSFPMTHLASICFGLMAKWSK